MPSGKVCLQRKKCFEHGEILPVCQSLESSICQKMFPLQYVYLIFDKLLACNLLT